MRRKELSRPIYPTVTYLCSRREKRPGKEGCRDPWEEIMRIQYVSPLQRVE